jgi:DNA-binding NarL/FixJ family response regulator
MCVDDHRIVRDGICLILNRQKDIKVVGTAVTGEEGVELFARCRPDVTLMDLRLGSMSGLEAIRAIRQNHPDARIIVLTTYQGDEDIYRALNGGAVTYLLKDTLSDDLVRVIREVHAGGRPMSPDIEARLAERAASGILTPRETEVIELIFRGMRNKEIGAALGISADTAEVHIRNILAKLKVNDRTAAVHVALRRGIIHSE